MMRPIYYTQSAAGTSNAIPLDWRNEYFTVSIGTVVTGTQTYSVEYTLDPPYTNDPDYVTPTWVPFTEATGETGSVNFSSVSPVRAIRLNVSAYTSGSVRLQIIHSG